LGFSAQLNYFMGWRSNSEFDWWPVNPRGVDDTLVNTPSQLKMDTYVFTYNTERASLLPRLDFSYERRMSPHSSLALSASLQHYSGQLQYRVYSREWDFSQQGTVYTEKSSSGIEDLVTRYGVFNMGIRYIYHLNINK
jgi:outer membrane protein TolC